MPYERPNNTMDIDSACPAGFSEDFRNTLPIKPTKPTKLYRELPSESNPLDEPTKLGKRSAEKTPLFLPDEDSVLHKRYKRTGAHTHAFKKGSTAPTVKLRRANATLVQTASVYKGTIRNQIDAMVATEQEMLEILQNEKAITLKAAEEEYAQRIADVHSENEEKERTLRAEYAKMEVCSEESSFPGIKLKSKLGRKGAREKEGTRRYAGGRRTKSQRMATGDAAEGCGGEGAGSNGASQSE
jgi:hypothetical protein